VAEDATISFKKVFKLSLANFFSKVINRKCKIIYYFVQNILIDVKSIAIYRVPNNDLPGVYSKNYKR
jgi:hypothetical protein